MSTVLDERAQRRARVNAAAASLVGREPRPRALSPPAAAALRPSSRRRLHAEAATRSRPARRRRSWSSRLPGVAMLCLELILVIAALTLPAFTPREVTIEGADLLSRDALLAAAAVPSTSIFAIDGAAVRDRLARLPMIRSVTVSTELPAEVRIAVAEWKPALRVVGAGGTRLVAASGAAVDLAATRPGAAPPLPVLIDARDPRRGEVGPGPPEARLVQLLDSVAMHFGEVFSCSVAAFQRQADGLFSIWTDRGWRAILGHLDTEGRIAAVPDQLAALAALRGTLSFTAPQFGYVNLESIEAPAVGGSPGVPAEVVAAAGIAPPHPTTAAAGAPPPAAPVPTPSPPRLAPTSPPHVQRSGGGADYHPQPVTSTSPGAPPYVIYLPQPTGH